MAPKIEMLDKIKFSLFFAEDYQAFNPITFLQSDQEVKFKCKALAPPPPRESKLLEEEPPSSDQCLHRFNRELKRRDDWRREDLEDIFSYFENKKWMSLIDAYDHIKK